jgi:hypothetical protein
VHLAMLLFDVRKIFVVCACTSIPACLHTYARTHARTHAPHTHSRCRAVKILALQVEKRFSGRRSCRWMAFLSLHLRPFLFRGGDSFFHIEQGLSSDTHTHGHTHTRTHAHTHTFAHTRTHTQAVAKNAELGITFDNQFLRPAPFSPWQ